MGLPGAGKSTVKQERMHREDLDIEADRWKTRHPKWSREMSEETDEEVHRWSVRRAADAFEDALTSPDKPNFVFDSSGSNASWLGKKIVAARDAGYITELLWVDVPVEVALFRNRDRAARGQRWVPEKVIMDKAAVMPQSFEALRRLADSTERLKNWCELDHELERAKRDFYYYPAPRTRPCTVRPGEQGYGEMPPGARSPSPTRSSMRTIRIGPWKRNDSVARRKNARLSWMDRTFRGERERFVNEHVLQGRDVLVEPNAYPYFMPPDIDHWTIWARRAMDHAELCEYIEGWLNARQPHNIIAWNYDDNRGRRTIDIWHVHIYFKGAGGQAPRIGSRIGGREAPEASSANKPASANRSAQRSPCSV